MKQKFSNATLKIYFTAGHTSRNLYNVTEMDKQEDMMRVVTHGNVVLLNWRNINTVEVIEERL